VLVVVVHLINQLNHQIHLHLLLQVKVATQRLDQSQLLVVVLVVDNIGMDSLEVQAVAMLGILVTALVVLELQDKETLVEVLIIMLHHQLLVVAVVLVHQAKQHQVVVVVMVEWVLLIVLLVLLFFVLAVAVVEVLIMVVLQVDQVVMVVVVTDHH
jgi:hypothetical protein